MFWCNVWKLIILVSTSDEWDIAWFLSKASALVHYWAILQVIWYGMWWWITESEFLFVCYFLWWWFYQIFYTSISAGTCQQKVSQDLPKMLYLNYSPVKGYLICIWFTNPVKDQGRNSFFVNDPTLNWCNVKGIEKR